VPAESDVQRAVISYVRRRPEIAFAGRINTIAMRTETGRPIWSHTIGKGVSDIIGMFRSGHWLALECKRPGGKPTPEQEQFIELVRSAGGCGAIVTSVDEAHMAIDYWVRFRVR
jgi:hypothetical protein